MILNTKNAKLIGLSYFTVLSLANLTWSIAHKQPFGLDLIILGFTLATLYANSKLVYLMAGSVGMLVSVYIGVACLIYQLNVLSNASNLSFTLGYLLASASFVCALLLVYTGIKFPATTHRPVNLHIS